MGSKGPTTSIRNEAARIKLRPWLDAKQRGEVITHEDVLAACGLSSRVMAPFIRTYMERAGKPLITIPGVGWRVPRPNEHGPVSDTRANRAKRQMRKAVRAVASAPLPELTDTERKAIELRAVRYGNALDAMDRDAREIGVELKKLLPPKS